MKIRRAVYDDAKVLNHLLTLLISDEKKYDVNINENFVVNNMYENYIEDPTRIILVAEKDAKIVGYLYGFIIDDQVNIEKVAKLDALYVVPEYRKLGIANSLVNDFKKWVDSKEVKRIEVSVCSANIAAKKLYVKHGFVKNKEVLLCDNIK